MFNIPKPQNLAVFSFLFLILSCQSSSLQNVVRLPNDTNEGSWLNEATKNKSVPSEVVQTIQAEWEAKKTSFEKKAGTVASSSPEQIKILAQYVDFLKLPESEKNSATTRLFESSTQFLFCNNLENWECLEKPSVLPALALYRTEINDVLGKPIQVEGPLKMKYYFTQQWYKTRKQLLEGSEQKVPEKASTADVLGQLLEQDWSRVSMAIYGIDGIGEVDSKTKQKNYSMKRPFEAMARYADIRAVVDVNSYKTEENSTHGVTYQYAQTKELYDVLNKNQPEADFKLRHEYPASNIMHNKFFVLEKNKKRSVWTGTANISKNCMGDEDFANMSVYIDSHEVASSYLTEFDEMYNFADPDEIKAPQLVGRFHRNKKPNTQRYFVFEDGHELRVHFSPTDDGEHRSIIPMILSARAGDVIRVSMFGSGGSEYVRALQYAAFKGATVKVFLDRDTSFQVPNSWINRKAVVKLQGPNPYGKVKGKLEIRHTNWGGGNMNHHKSATLTRKKGKNSVAEILILGSQNWSLAGNDDNDENMVSIRNFKGVAAAQAFNEHFDRFIWPTGKPVPFELK
jgi:phosphatidylserine/phosphatidylglycerophosphate/cardiolipin synthase-like enzyme